MGKIVVTNDDGINATGLYRLVQVAKELGEVVVVAPDRGRSANSHSITLTQEIEVYPYDLGIEGIKAYACSGTPADCVRIAKYNIVNDKIDLVLSGINNGYNVGLDLQYSATAGAAFESIFQGIKAVAISEGDNSTGELSEKYLLEILNKIIDIKIEPYQIHNINFPNCAYDDCKGILYDRKVCQGSYYFDIYKEIEQLPNGGKKLIVEGLFNENVEENTDLKAILDKYISVGVVNNIR